MAIEYLGVVGLDGPGDYVYKVQIGYDEDAKVLGKVNTISGAYTPPELKEIVAECGPQSRAVESVMAEALHPVSESKFTNIEHDTRFNPTSSLVG